MFGLKYLAGMMTLEGAMWRPIIPGFVLLLFFLLTSSGCDTYSHLSLFDFGPANPQGEEATVARFDSLNIKEKPLKDYADDPSSLGHEHGSNVLSSEVQDAVSGQMQGQMKRRKLYTCPMHPEVISEKPGNCPKCGMKLIEKRDARE